MGEMDTSLDLDPPVRMNIFLRESEARALMALAKAERRSKSAQIAWLIAQAAPLFLRAEAEAEEVKP